MFQLCREMSTWVAHHCCETEKHFCFTERKLSSPCCNTLQMHLDEKSMLNLDCCVNHSCSVLLWGEQWRWWVEWQWRFTIWAYLYHLRIIIIAYFCYTCHRLTHINTQYSGQGFFDRTVTRALTLCPHMPEILYATEQCSTHASVNAIMPDRKWCHVMLPRSCVSGACLVLVAFAGAVDCVDVRSLRRRPPQWSIGASSAYSESPGVSCWGFVRLWPRCFPAMGVIPSPILSQHLHGPVTGVSV